MSPQKIPRSPPLAIISLLSLLILLCVPAASDDCTLELQNPKNGMHVVVENCENIGTFSLGAIYNGEWEKLTYHYPMPWKGTFLTIRVDDKFYTNSLNPPEGIKMDQYLWQSTVTKENTISVKWVLPEGILVEEVLEIIENSTLIHVKITNENPSTDFDVGARLHIDTMIGDNDGAPIYVPGDALKVNEVQYLGSDLNFRYWKAYNRRDKPSIVATGILDMGGELTRQPTHQLTYPDKVIIANWKKSMKSVWDYGIGTSEDNGLSILGDSAVILYYNPLPLDSGQTREIVTGYGSGEPVLRKVSAIAEIVLENIAGKYCPGDDVAIKVDVGSHVDFDGSLGVEIKNRDGILLYNKSTPTGFIKAESIKSLEFNFRVPPLSTSDEFNVSARLYLAGDQVDEKSAQFSFDTSDCVVLPVEETEEKGPNWLLLVLFVIVVLILIFIAYPKKREVMIEKIKEYDTARITVWNKTKEDIENCIVEDRIVEGAEVSVSTIHVMRSGTELIWSIGTLKVGEKAVLEYRIRGVNVLPRALVRWDGGEKISK